VDEDYNEADDYTPNVWETDADLLNLRRHTSEDFDKAFREGMQAYIQGDWQKSRSAFERATAMKAEIGGDGPCKTLLSFMSGHEFICPEDWKGYRPLTNK